jgi:Ca2+-binding EF-hand superfamily protein
MRKRLFYLFDPNGNGYLSLSEVQRAVRDIIGSDEMFDAKPAIMRAFQAAKGAVDTESKLGADFVEWSEFRALLVYLKRYFELYQMFARVDSGGDHRINAREFKAAVPSLKAWRPDLELSDPAAVFAKIDGNGGGEVLFGEFCNWALGETVGENDVEEGDAAEEGARGSGGGAGSRNRLETKSTTTTTNLSFSTNNKKGGWGGTREGTAGLSDAELALRHNLDIAAAAQVVHRVHKEGGVNLVAPPSDLLQRLLLENASLKQQVAEMGGGDGAGGGGGGGSNGGGSGRDGEAKAAGGEG